MQFKVPQFLDIEDKIFGPFTFKQFIYLVGGGGVCFVIYKALGFFVGLIPMLLVGGFSGLLIYYKPNDKPFIYLLEAGFKYITQNKLYIWQRRKAEKAEKDSEKEKSAAPQNYEARLTGNKLRDLAWSLDVLDLKKEK